MSILEFLNRTVAFLGSILPWGVAILFIVSVYGWMSQDDYDDDYVTFTVSCKAVLHDETHYPDYIVNYCNDHRSNK